MEIGYERRRCKTRGRRKAMAIICVRIEIEIAADLPSADCVVVRLHRVFCCAVPGICCGFVAAARPGEWEVGWDATTILKRRERNKITDVLLR